MLYVHVKISCFQAKAHWLAFHSIWCLYNKRNNLSEQAIRDVPDTWEQYKSLPGWKGSREVSKGYTMALGGSFAAYGNSRSICRWNDSLFWRLKIVKLLVEVGGGWGGGGPQCIKGNMCMLKVNSPFVSSWTLGMNWLNWLNFSN